MYRQRMPISFYIFIFLIIAIVSIPIISMRMRKTDYQLLVTSEEQLRRMIYECASDYKTDIKFKTTIDLRSCDYDAMFREIMDKDTYIGCEIFGYGYQYKPNKDGTMDAEIRIKNPAWHRVWLTKLRVKQIADRLRDLDRYDQIKAVHDYLVATNEYAITIGSAFNALYVNKSACNGYAFSFYAIMEELGIPATVEYGGSHAWNSVELDGEWYNIDCTWDDRGGKEIYYDYFLKSNEDFKRHEHTSGTALKSYDMDKAGISEYYHRIPPYRIIMIAAGFGLAILCYVIFRLINKK